MPNKGCDGLGTHQELCHFQVATVVRCCFPRSGGGSTPANHALPPATVGFNTGGDLSQKKSGIAGEIFAGFLKTARTNFVDFSKKQNWLEKIRGISFLAFFSFSK